MIKNLSVTVGEGRYRVELYAGITADGVVCQLYGGTKPHVGAVVLSLPRPSLQNSRLISCNSSVLPRLGHKDDEIAKPLAEELARQLNQPVVLVAGLHIDEATAEEIQLLCRHCRQAVEQFLNHPERDTITPVK
ncbi:hypothetical protein [Desulforamulus hydrothermalis]|uniref:Prenylated flavin chaperone LpdD-like domain-containing protein n=1 Tax=Desulforamulus hydrothermalis Lam5 = DSM 18033 TaxID=1121428 RepID=K8DWV8_9FIRM|nr:hypothetical protein [Desulforamulus hydrothermalis]CCO06972.1 conserved hypothetical protein [Desulforamulus hydrothermalis Lam5 = DSM 18033]SHG98508.1 hypothetical protein SAMN02745177_01016 [Desulforamulus hydrothermalis Lam5 = DSM 18033]